MNDLLLKKHPELVVAPTSSLREAIAIITKTTVGIVLVAGTDGSLQGILVDSDIRRALLSGRSLEMPVAAAMNKEPFTALDSLSREALAALFRQRRRAYIPLVDKQGRVAGLAAMSDYLSVPQAYPNWVVIMAGGQGTRLRPLTDNTPKPMMRIGDKPLLELVLERLVANGLTRFLLSVNYLAGQIKDHFGDGSRWGAQVEYVSETSEMGTAGALSLIERRLEHPFIVMNGDLLTKVNFRALLDFHQNDKNLATLCVREYDFQVPYGVVQMKDQKLANIVEKPVHRFFVNAGIYVLEPETLGWLRKDARRDMPNFLDEIRGRREGSVGCFPVQEYWLDIGKVEDYQRALQEYDQQFLS